MTAPLQAPVAAFLLRTGIIAGILAVLAGIFGMHVMTGNHTMHSMAAAHPPAASTVATGGGSSHDSSSHHDMAAASPATAAGPVAGHPLVSSVVACTCSTDCTGSQSMNSSCTPSAKTGSLTAPDPGSSTRAHDHRAGLPDGACISYAYLPGTPSPGELSISRT